jgi:cysteinyl-tRNA synthetase
VIVALVKALQYLLEIKAVRAHWELERDIEHYIARAQEEIIRARNTGDHARADRVRQQLLRSSGIAVTPPDFAITTRADAHGGDR